MDINLRKLVALLWIMVLASCTELPDSDLDEPVTPMHPTTASRPIEIKSTSTQPQVPTRASTSTDVAKSVSTSTLNLPTFTSLPTLSDSDAEKLVTDLLTHNADCMFPCWWGIIPGKTSMPEAYHFLISFVEVTSPLSMNNNNSEPSKNLTYQVKYPLQNELGRGGFNIYTEYDQIMLIFVGKDSTLHNSLLHQILNNYNRPDNIYIRTFKDVPGDDFPLTLVLSYVGKNFVLAYDLIAHAENDELISCYNGESPVLWLWSPEEIVTEQRLQDWTLGVDPIIPLKPLEQVTDLDTKSFTEIFSTSNGGSNCLRTNKNYWDIER